jgi:hypothetical protein
MSVESGIVPVMYVPVRKVKVSSIPLAGVISYKGGRDSVRFPVVLPVW